MKKSNVLKQMLKKSTAILSVAAMCVTAFAPVSYAAKQSPAMAADLNFGYNNFEIKNSDGLYIGTPWINKIQWNDPATGKEGGIVDSCDTEHNNVQYIGYNTGSPKEFATYYTTFSENYKVNDDVYEAKYPRYSMSFDFYLPQSDVAYKFMMKNREKIDVVNQDGTKTQIEPYIATFDILPGSDGAMIGLHQDAPQAYDNILPEKCITQKISKDTWYRARFDIDTVAETVSMFIDNKFIASYDYGAYYDKLYQSYTPLSGLVSRTLIWGGTEGPGWVLGDYINDTPGMYFDNLSMDYIVDGAFYATGVIENDNIKVTLSDTASQTINKSGISVKKSDGTNVAIGDVSGDDKVITIPLTNREGGVEYVVILPEGITDNNGNKLYTNYVFVESPIKATDVEYLINEDFEGEVYNWITDGTGNLVDGAKLPEYAVANKPKFQKITTAYKDNATGEVSTEADEAKNKVLQVKHNEPAACGLWFNLPEPIVSDFTIEFDYMTDYIQEGASNTQFVASQGVVRDCESSGHPRVLDTENGLAYPVYKNYETGTENYFTNQFIFGFSDGGTEVKFGAPNYNTADAGRYWTSTYKNGEYVYDNSQITPQANKWYNIKLEFELSGKSATEAMLHAIVKDGDNTVIDVKIPTAIGLFSPSESGVQIQSIGFQNYWNAHYYESTHHVSNMYLDNLKVYSYNRTDNRVKTVTLNDIDGDDFGAVQTISDNVITANVQLATEKTVVSQTVTKDVIKVTDQDETPVEFTFDGYDEGTKSFDITFNKFLEKGKKYNLTIDGIYAYSGTNGINAAACLKLPAYTAQINVTDTGKPEVKAVFKLVDSNGNEVKYLTQDTSAVKISATIKNTTDKAATAKTMICGYQNGLLKNIMTEDIEVSAGNYKTFTSNEYTIDAATDALKSFIWKDLSSLEPVADNKTIVK